MVAQRFLVPLVGVRVPAGLPLPNYCKTTTVIQMEVANQMD
jgi:hypothetical protein